MVSKICLPLRSLIWTGWWVAAMLVLHLPVRPHHNHLFQLPSLSLSLRPFQHQVVRHQVVQNQCRILPQLLQEHMGKNWWVGEIIFWLQPFNLFHCIPNMYKALELSILVGCHAFFNFYMTSLAKELCLMVYLLGLVDLMILQLSRVLSIRVEPRWPIQRNVRRLLPSPKPLRNQKKLPMRMMTMNQTMNTILLKVVTMMTKLMMLKVWMMGFQNPWNLVVRRANPWRDLPLQSKDRLAAGAERMTTWDVLDWRTELQFECIETVLHCWSHIPSWS